MSNTAVPFELFSPDYFRDPYTALDWLRVNSPVHRYVFPVGDVPMWVVTRYDDAMAILADTRFSTAEWRGSAEFQASGLSVSGGTILAQTIPGLDPPEHTRVRRCAMSGFTPRNVDRWREDIRRVIDETIQDWELGQEKDLVAEFAALIPPAVIATRLGFALDRREELARDVDLLISTNPADFPRIPGARERICDYGRELVALKRAEPGDDLTSAFIRAADEEGRITEDELVALVIIMIIAGVGTTKMFITNAMLALLDHPDQRKMISDDPAILAASGIEELLRYESPVASVPWRFPTEAVRVGEVDIAPGEPVMVMIASANRDPDVFDDPHRLDLTRTGSRHLGLGHGIHNCLGAAVARLISEMALATLIERFPDLRLAIPREEIRRHEVWALNDYRALPVTL
ncbi:cytochrome P450 hydroxylase [Acrocarpospora corrugata]|uniref:Cytochrome P450 hydroxylase n=1 Tax=Acrocarpospora corrugata TaxID=35763 RepID=A0A5M3W6W8_9ACTN|nr:cytochrome P450 [Acrocarpospora corrugata]GES03682.1 cytochrome P450 hydroxylase [Acrocarpospora corrugata]